MAQVKIGRALLGAVVVASLSLTGSVQAADHRDAPTIDEYSAIDITDLFMFRDPSDSNELVMVLSVQSVADPLFQPSYHFQQNALYRLNFTTRKDAQRTASIDIAFGPFANQPECPSPNPACQPFQVRFPNGGVVEGFATQGTAGATHLAPVFATDPASGIKVFAGPREDPFFFDLVGFNRSIAAGASKFTGVDAFLGSNVNAIVLEFPTNTVFPAGSCIATTSPVFTTPCGAWAATYLAPLPKDGDPEFVMSGQGIPQGTYLRSCSGAAVDGGSLVAQCVNFHGDVQPSSLAAVNRCTGDIGNNNGVLQCNFGGPGAQGVPVDGNDGQLDQVDRMGNPAVNTALIPAALKDSFNFGQPQNDARDYAQAILNQILALDKAFGTCPATATSAAACNPNVPLLASVAVPDLLRFASNIADGYPNGRQLADRVTDVLISLILQIPSFTDGTATKTYCSAFPFVGPPLQLSGTAPFQLSPQTCP
jgi:hypothetical protein